MVNNRQGANLTIGAAVSVGDIYKYLPRGAEIFSLENILYFSIGVKNLISAEHPRS